MKNHKAQLSSKLPTKQQNPKSKRKVDGVSNYTTNDYSELVDFLNNSEQTISYRSQLGHFPNMYKMENMPNKPTNYKMLSNSRKVQSQTTLRSVNEQKNGEEPNLQTTLKTLVGQGKAPVSKLFYHYDVTEMLKDRTDPAYHHRDYTSALITKARQQHALNPQTISKMVKTEQRNRFLRETGANSLSHRLLKNKTQSYEPNNFSMPFYAETIQAPSSNVSNMPYQNYMFEEREHRSRLGFAASLKKSIHD